MIKESRRGGEFLPSTTTHLQRYFSLSYDEFRVFLILNSFSSWLEFQLVRKQMNKQETKNKGKQNEKCICFCRHSVIYILKQVKAKEKNVAEGGKYWKRKGK